MSELFAAFEREGWERAANGYDRLVGSVTRRLNADVLAAAEVGPGVDLLEIGCGPGHLAGESATAGARAVGLDVAEAMLARARDNYPALAIQRGSAEELPFPDDRFDAVVGNLVILHLARPEAAVAEAARVLRPGGRLVLTTWDVAERCRLLGLMLEALTVAGASTPTSIPSGPAFFRFADDSSFTSLLSGAGFSEISIRRIGFDQMVTSADALWEGIVEGSVRTSALVRAQSLEVQQRARAQLADALMPYAGDDGYRIPVSVKLARGCLPAGA